MKSPLLVSVIIPTYNRGKRIVPTVESVFAQTLPREQYEIIIVDDGSTDETLAFLQHEYSKYDNIRIFSQPNGGVANARNKGLQEAHGEFVAFLDHDDIWLPEKLEKQVAAFSDTRVAVVYCLWWEVDQDGHHLPNDQQLIEKTWWFAPTGHVYDQFVRNNYIISMSIPLIRTNALREIDGFDSTTVPCDDWDLWLRLGQRYLFDVLPEKLVLYFHHAQQQSTDNERMNQGANRVFAKQRRYLLLKPRLLFSIIQDRSFCRTSSLYNEAKTALFEARFKDALKLVVRAWSLAPVAFFTRQWLCLTIRILLRKTSHY